MSDPTSTIQTLVSDLSSLAPGVAAVDDVAKAITAVTNSIVGPLLSQSQTSKINNEQQYRIQSFQEIMSLPDSLARAQRLSAFYQQLCIDGKLPTGELSGRVESIPIEVIQSLTIQGIDGIAARDQLYAITATLKGGTVASK